MRPTGRAGPSSLWRGDPLDGIDSGLLASREVPRLAEMRLQALETCHDADLRLGRHADVITELRRLAACHPLRERLHAQLMLALCHDGRQAEALDVYQRARRILISELGTEPGPGLRELHRQVLAGEPGAGAEPPAAADRDAPAAARGSAALHRAGGPAGGADRAAGPVPCGKLGHGGDRRDQRDARGGQDGARGALGAPRRGAVSRRAAVREPAGLRPVGCAAAARGGDPRVPGRARRSRCGCPGRGAGPGRAVSQPAGGAPDADLARQRPRRRSGPALAAGLGRLPGPGDQPQPADRACRRRRRPPAHRGRAHRRRGPDAAEPPPGGRPGRRRASGRRRALSMCARLPLALNIAAARAAVRPDRSLAAVAAALRGRAGPAGRLRYRRARQQRPNGVLVVLSRPQRAGRPDVPAAGPAPGAGYHRGRRGQPGRSRTRPGGAVPRRADRRSPAGGAGSRPVLLPRPAARLRRRAGPRVRQRPAREAALGRMLDHYLHTAHAAAGLLCPGRDLLILPAPRDGTRPEPPAAGAEALAWFAAERPVVSAAVRLAADAGLDAQAWQLGWLLGRYLHRSGYWQEWVAVLRTALAAAEHAADLAGQAHVHRDLGGARIVPGLRSRRGRSSEAGTGAVPAARRPRGAGPHPALPGQDAGGTAGPPARRD